MQHHAVVSTANSSWIGTCIYNNFKMNNTFILILIHFIVYIIWILTLYIWSHTYSWLEAPEVKYSFRNRSKIKSAFLPYTYSCLRNSKRRSPGRLWGDSALHNRPDRIMICQKICLRKLFFVAETWFQTTLLFVVRDMVLKLFETLSVGQGPHFKIVSRVQVSDKSRTTTDGI